MLKRIAYAGTIHQKNREHASSSHFFHPLVQACVGCTTEIHSREWRHCESFLTTNSCQSRFWHHKPINNHHHQPPPIQSLAPKKSSLRIESYPIITSIPNALTEENLFSHYWHTTIRASALGEHKSQKNVHRKEWKAQVRRHRRRNLKLGWRRVSKTLSFRSLLRNSCRLSVVPDSLQPRSLWRILPASRTPMTISSWCPAISILASETLTYPQI